MFTNTILALTLLVSTLVLPDVSNMTLVNGGQIACPNGTTVQVEVFDPDPNAEPLVIRFSRDGEVIGIIDGRDDKLYVPNDRAYTMQEAEEKFGKPCNLPNVIKS